MNKIKDNIKPSLLLQNICPLFCNNKIRFVFLSLRRDNKEVDDPDEPGESVETDRLNPDDAH